MTVWLYRALSRFLALSALFTSFSLASTFYVSPSGNNTTGKGTVGSPWKTITFAIDSLYPGDTLYLRAGVYNEQMTTVRNGNPGAYITISGYGAEDAFVDGTGGLWNNGVIVDHSYLRLTRFVIRAWLHTGIWLRNCQFVELKNLRITDVTGGISLTGTVHDFVVDSCTIYDYYGGAGGSGFDATPYGTDSIYNGVIQNCKAYLTTGAFDNCDGFALGHDGVSNILLYNCEVYGVGDGFDISGRNIVLERCSAHGCTYGGGYKLWRDNVTLINCIAFDNSTNVELDFDGATQKGVQARLVNCTLFSPGTANIAIENSAGGSTLQLYNSILAGGDNVGLYFDGDTISCYRGDYNLFHLNTSVRMIATSQRDFSLTEIQNNDWTSHSGQDAHTQTVVDPNTLFEDTLRASPDLHLIAGSVAIDNGFSLPDAPAFDFDNCPRTVGPIDIGAFEFGACGTSAVTDRSRGPGDSYRLYQNYPNPFNPATVIGFHLAAGCTVRLAVYDILGREIAVLVNERKAPGSYTVNFDASGLASGVYLYRMTADRTVLSGKMMMVR